MENLLWFNEDDDCVCGYRNCFESKEDFIKSANELHVNQTGYGCIVDEVECDVFILTEKTLQGESSYLLKDSGAEIATLYHANCESLEGYDLKFGDGVVDLKDGTSVNLKGQKVEITDKGCCVCNIIIPSEEHEKNNGFCNKCLKDIQG